MQYSLNTIFSHTIKHKNNRSIYPCLEGEKLFTAKHGTDKQKKKILSPNARKMIMTDNEDETVDEQRKLRQNIDDASSHYRWK